MNSDILFTFSRQTGDFKAQVLEFLDSNLQLSPVAGWNSEGLLRSESPKFSTLKSRNEVSELQMANLAA
jgi:hypothetical protein